MACSGQLRTVLHRMLCREGYYGMFWSAAYSLTQNVVQRRIFSHVLVSCVQSYIEFVQIRILWHVLVSCVQSYTECCPDKDIMACSGQLRTVSHRTLSREGYYGMFWSAAYSLTQNVVQIRILWHVLVSCVQSYKELCSEKDILACSGQLRTVLHRMLPR